MKPEHSGSPPLRRPFEATVAKPAGTGFTPALLGKPLPLGRGWGRHGEPRERCAQNEWISLKTPNPRGGKGVKDAMHASAMRGIMILNETKKC